MSIYAGAVQSGLNLLSVMGGDNAATVAAYNTEFATVSNQMAMHRQRSAAEQNISAVNQDRITSNINIQRKQDEAEAQAKVNAALAGAQGGSVEASINQTKVNESFAIQANNQKAEQQTEQLKATVHSSTMAAQSRKQTPDPSYVGDLAKAFSSFELSDLEIYEAQQADAGTLRV